MSYGLAWRLGRRISRRWERIRQGLSRLIYPRDYELLIKLLAEKAQRKK